MTAIFYLLFLPMIYLADAHGIGSVGCIRIFRRQRYRWHRYVVSFDQTPPTFPCVCITLALACVLWIYELVLQHFRLTASTFKRETRLNNAWCIPMQYQCTYPHIPHIYICTRALCCTHTACNFNLPPHPLNLSINFFLLFPTSFGQRVGLAMFATATACRRKTKRNRPHMNTVSRHPTDGIRGLHKKIFNQHKYTCPNLTNIVTEQEGESANAKRHAKDQAHCFLNVHGFHHSGTGYVRETIREMFPTQASTHNFGRVDRYPQQEGAWGSEALPGKRMITRALLPTGIYSNR